MTKHIEKIIRFLRLGFLFRVGRSMFNVDGPVKSPEKDLIAKLAQGKSNSYKVTSFGF